MLTIIIKPKKSFILLLPPIIGTFLQEVATKISNVIKNVIFFIFFFILLYVDILKRLQEIN